MARIPQIIRRNPLSQVAPQAPQAGQGWAALADLASVAADFVKPAALDEARQRGEKSVYRDDQGNLKVDERSLYSGEMGAMQNQAAYAKYLSQKSIDLNQTMSELAVKYEFDPAGFQEASAAYTKTLRDDPNVPNVLKEDIVRSVEEGAGRQFNGLHRKEIDRTYKAADTQTATARDMLMDDYVSLTVEGDEEGAAAKWKEIEELSRMRANAPYINETPAETEAMMRGARGTAKAATLLRDLADLEGADEISDEQRSELTTLLKDPDISPKARQSLYAATQGRLKSIDAAGIVKGLTNDSFEAKVARLSRIAVGGAQRGDSFTGMNDQFSSGLDAMIAAAPESVQKSLKVSSGFRSVARQKELWAGALKKYGSVAEARKWVAPPGNSQHGHGNAADLKFQSDEAKQWVHANAGQFGLSFPLSNEPWHIELATARGGGGGVTPKQRTANQTALTDAGVQVSDANEFLAVTFGAGKAVAMLKGDDPTALAEIPEDVLAANPELKGKTVREVQNWATRKMTVKASDMAAMAVQIDQIEDPEVRKLASQGLDERIEVRRNIEDAAASVFEERIASGDVSLTEQQIREDHDLSTDDQVRLTTALDKVNKDADDMRSIVKRMNGTDNTFDPMDAADKKDVNKVYDAIVGDAPATSEQGANAAASITKKTGIIPKRAANAIRSAVKSDDPNAVGTALESLAQLKALAGDNLAGVTGAKGLEDTLSDYQFYGQFMGSEEAASQIVKNRETKPKNVTTEAKEAAKKLNISDITDRFDKSFFSTPKVGDARAGEGSASLLTGAQENEMMGEYTRLFKDAYAETADFDLSQNRALDKMDRIYGVNEVSGEGRVMKFPPQAMYKQVGGSHQWQTDQLVSEVNDFINFDKDVEGVIDGDLGGEVLLPGGRGDTVTLGGGDDIVVAEGSPPQKTGETTSEGRPVWIDSSGEKYSERTTTIQAADGKWYNVPTVDDRGGQLDESLLASTFSKKSNPKDAITGSALEGYDNVDTAIAAAKKRSDALLSNNKAEFTVNTAKDLPSGPGTNRLERNQIALWSDEVSAREAKTGKPVSYVVYVMRDNVLEPLPRRFTFDRASAEAKHKADFENNLRPAAKAAKAVQDERVSTQQELTSGILDRFEEE
tara:strand:- start:518 stop:3901 length:3384 start_codon:yes stop_codon:yes gene_type:complete